MGDPQNPEAQSRNSRDRGDLYGRPYVEKCFMLAEIVVALLDSVIPIAAESDFSLKQQA